MAKHDIPSSVSKTRWKPGDLALVINPNRFLTMGRVHTVEKVLPNVDWKGAPRGPGLVLHEVKHPENKKHNGEFAAFRFIKVTPKKPDTFDREIISRMAPLSTSGVER